MLFDTKAIQRLAERAETLLARVEGLLPRATEPDWDASIAFRWRRRPTAFGWQSWLQPVRHRSSISLDDLQNIDEPKRLIERNTRHFVQGLPANNVLLTGSRGTGKSSLIKACLNAHAAEGLRLIEVDKADLVDLPDIVDLVADRPEKFVVYCDDLSFEEGEAGYKALKTALDGSVAAASDNVLIYATSNRRHLMPEKMSENLAAKHTEDGEIHPGETSEEKISLSERFGLWVAFYPFRQDDYLVVVAHWLGHFGCSPAQIEAARGDALRWALERGSRSGRVAWQFARDWAGGEGDTEPRPRSRAAKAPKRPARTDTKAAARTVATRAAQGAGARAAKPAAATPPKRTAPSAPASRAEPAPAPARRAARARVR